MHITEIQLATLTIPLIRPFSTAVRTTHAVQDVVVLLKTNTGHIGYGSAASTPAITGDTTESIIEAIQYHLGPPLLGRSVTDCNRLLQMTQEALLGNSSAKAAIDIALHDLLAQYCGVPLYQLLGGEQNSVESCITISLNDLPTMVNEAKELALQGYKTLKIKLGRKTDDDIGRVVAIRQSVGPDIQLLIDANQGWSCSDALYILDELKKQQLEITMIEQPVPAKNVADLKHLSTQSPWSIVADESCFSPQDAFDLAASHSCDGLNIKLMKSGGLGQAQAIYHIAKTAGLELMVGCMLESPIGVAAIASFALSKPDICYADLDPLFLIRENYVHGGAQTQGTKIVLPNRPGLGIEGFRDGLKLIGSIS